MAAPRPRLGYWDARGIAEPIRMLLAHLGVAYEDKTYVHGGAPEFDQGQWPQDKASLPMNYPNLPYFVDGEFHLSESWAILKYICGKHKKEYLGRDIRERAHVAMLQGVLTDLRIGIAKVHYADEVSQEKTNTALRNSETPLRRLASYLSGKRFLISDKPTYVDFYFYEFLQMLEAWAPGTAANISDVFAVYEANVRSLANVAAFEARPRFPFNSKRANCLNS